MKLILIRHSKTKYEPNVASLLWKLTDEGIKLARDLSINKIFKEVHVLYSSYQTKAIETALLIAKDNYIPIKFDDKLTELTSITNGFIENYEKSTEELYNGTIERINNGETLNEGLMRFNNAIDQITAAEKDKNTIAIVSHCNILSLFSAQFADKTPYEIHGSMKMPDIAILDWDRKQFIKFFRETI